MTTANIVPDRLIGAAVTRERSGGPRTGQGAEGSDADGMDFLHALSKLKASGGELQSTTDIPLMPDQSFAGVQKASDPVARLGEFLGRMPHVGDRAMVQRDAASDQQDIFVEALGADAHARALEPQQNPPAASQASPASRSLSVLYGPTWPRQLPPRPLRPLRLRPATP